MTIFDTPNELSADHTTNALEDFISPELCFRVDHIISSILHFFITGRMVSESYVS